MIVNNIPYSRKIWRELYLAKWPPGGQKLILAEFRFGDWQSRISHTNFYYVIVFRTAEVRTWFHWSAKTEVKVMEEFQLQSCVRGHHIYKKYLDSVVGGSTFCGLAASRLMLRLTLAFAFSRSFWVRVDDSYVIFLGSVGLSFCLYTFELHFAFVQRLNDIQQNLGGYKIWRELNLAMLAPIAKPPN